MKYNLNGFDNRCIFQVGEIYEMTSKEYGPYLKRNEYTYRMMVIKLNEATFGTVEVIFYCFKEKRFDSFYWNESVFGLAVFIRREPDGTILLLYKNKLIYCGVHFWNYEQVL